VLSTVRPRPDVFLRLEQHLLKKGSATPAALVDVDRPRNGRTTGYEDVIIGAMERESWISAENLSREIRLFPRRILEVLRDHH
jgi:CO/xanthine dehydrogenase FAD-binding subunit